MAVSFQTRSERGGGGCRDEWGKTPAISVEESHTHTETQVTLWTKPTTSPLPKSLLSSPCPQTNSPSVSFSRPPSARPHRSSTWQGLLPRSHISLDYTGTLTVACSCQGGPASWIHTHTKNYSIAWSGTEQEGGTTRADGKSAGRMIH